MNIELNTRPETTTNFIRYLVDWARVAPDKTAFINLQNGDSESATLNYNDLLKRSRVIAGKLLESCQPGDAVLLAYPSGLEFICSFMACLYSGIIAVPVPVPRSRRSISRIEGIVKDCDCRYLLTDSRTRERIAKRIEGNITVKTLDYLVTDQMSGANQSIKLSPTTELQTAFIQYTSGSTSEPRGVVISHKNLTANLAMQQAAATTDERSVFVSWLPMFHDMGLIGMMLHSIYVGAICVFMPPEAFVEKPVRWLRAVTRYRGTFSLAPNFAYNLCSSHVNEEDKQGLDLSSWVMAGNGAEPVRARDIHRFNDLYTPFGLRPTTVIPCYGLAEATLFVSSTPAGGSMRWLHLDREGLSNDKVVVSAVPSSQTQTIVSCGSGWLRQEIIVVNPETRVKLRENQIGEVWLSGDHIPQGYWNNETASAEVFHAFDAEGGGPYLRTGDLGFLNDGELFITGRLKDLIILNGKNYYPQDIEHICSNAVPGLRTDSSIAFSIINNGVEQLVIVQEVEKQFFKDEGSERILSTIANAVGDELNISAHDIVLVRAATLPKTSSGKQQRRLCRSLYQQKRLTVLASLRDSSQESAFEQTLLQRLKRGADLDSLAGMGLFGMQIPRRYGGLELTHRQMVAVLTQIAAHDICLAMYLGVHHASSYTIVHYACESLRAVYLPKLASGDLLAAFALTENNAGSNPNALQCEARVTDLGWRLSGDKSFVGHGQHAGLCTVFAREFSADRDSPGISAFVVSVDDFRGDIEAVNTLGMRCLKQAHLHLRSTSVAQNNRLGNAGEGMDIAYATLHYNRLGVAAIALGAMQSCLQQMQVYATHRQIATGMLNDNPVTQHRFNRLRNAISVVDLMVQTLASWSDDGRAIPPELFIAAKNLAAESLWRAADDYVQLCGWRAYEDDHSAAKLLRDARGFRLMEGPSEALDHFLGTRMLQGASQLGEFFNSLGEPDPALTQFKRWIQSHKSSSNLFSHQLGHVANYVLALMMLPHAADRIHLPKLQQAKEWLGTSIDEQLALINLRASGGQQLSAEKAEHYPLSETTAGVAGENAAVSYQSVLKEIQQWISKASAGRYSPDDIQPNKSLYDFGVDSIMIMELSFYLEKFLNRGINVEMIWEHPNLGAFINALVKESRAQTTKPTTKPTTKQKTLQATARTIMHADAERKAQAVAATSAAGFSLFYFASNCASHAMNKYQLLMDSARYADANGFEALWLPERHFHEFGGIYPSPSSLAAALAMTTKKIRIRSGSVVLPLHDPIRVAEEWSVADNLSGGRIDMGFAAGWNVNDFVLSPQNYADRVSIMYRGISTVRTLWRGEAISAINARGDDTRVRLYPLPVQKELTVWVTCSGGIERFQEAGRGGFHVITALLFQTEAELAENITAYRRARAESGFNPDNGKITLMLHTFVGADVNAVRQAVYDPFIGYLQSSVDLWRQESVRLEELSPEERAKVLHAAFERYFHSAALFGTPQTLLPRIQQLTGAGVNEFACLIDFGVSNDLVMEGLAHLVQLMRMAQPEAPPEKTQDSTPEPVRQLHTMSANQKSLWFLQQLSPREHAYDVVVAYRLETPAIPVLQQALNALMERHPILSSTVVVKNDEPCLQSGRYPKAQLQVHEHPRLSWRELAEGLRPQQFNPFERTDGFLFQAHLYKCADNESVLLLRSHHIISDFWSYGVLRRELQLIYPAIKQGVATALAPGYSFFDHLASLKTSLNETRLGELYGYWRRKLAGASMHIELPRDAKSNVQPGFSGDSIDFDIEGETVRRLNELAAASNTTLFTLLLTVYAVFLNRYTNQEDILIGTPSLGRNEPRLMGSFGYYANTLVIRADVTGEPDLPRLLARMDNEVKSSMQHQDLPFSYLVEQLQPQQRRGRSPLIQVLFDLITPDRFEHMIERNITAPGPADETLPLESIAIAQQQGQFELTLEVIELKNALRFTLKYNSDLFLKETVSRMAFNLQTLVNSIVQAGSESVCRLPFISRDEMAMIQKHYWRKRRQSVYTCLNVLFKHSVERYPDHAALQDPQMRLSYRELHAQAEAFARSMLVQGIEPGAIIGIHMERGCDQLVAILGTLLCGCAYLPLDAATPRRRVLDILDDAGVKFVIIQQQLAENIKSEKIRLLEFASILQAVPDAHLPLPMVNDSDLAYVLYTSGSTGKPKGVPITHGNVAHFLFHMQQRFELRSDDVWTLFHSTSFDFSVWEIWGAWIHGACVLVVPREISRDPQAFYGFTRKHDVSVLNQTPSAFRQYIEIDARRACKTNRRLRTIFFSGERLDTDMLTPWFERHGDKQPELYNMYGITETTVMTLARRITREDVSASVSPLGFPFEDTSVYLLNETLEPVPIGVAGEIYIDGKSVASRYLNRPELTKERMLANRLQPNNGLLYRTGDLARLNLNGELEYMGRRDRQVKIRGYRIELPEIEAAFKRCAGVRQAVAAVREYDHKKQILAYVVVNDSAITVTQILSQLRPALPDYMQPARVVVLDAIPMNANGKVDMDKLAAYDLGDDATSEGRLVAYDQHLAEIWASVLGVSPSALRDSYFESGGDSLSLLKLALEIERKTGQHIPVADLLQNSSFAAQSQLLGSRRAKPKPFSKKVRHFIRPIIAPVVATLLSNFYRAVMSTVKVTEINKPAAHSAKNNPARLLAHWHGDGLLLMKNWQYQNLVLMASTSYTGRLMSRILRQRGFTIVEGSQSSGGSAGIQSLIPYLRSDGKVALAVDGSRGPRHVVKQGIVELSRHTRTPVQCVAASVDRAWVAENVWDRIAMPKPFSHVYIYYGDCIQPADFGNDVNAHLNAVQCGLNRAKRYADKIVYDMYRT